jgi:hypothetical protein
MESLWKSTDHTGNPYMRPLLKSVGKTQKRSGCKQKTSKIGIGRDSQTYSTASYHSAESVDQVQNDLTDNQQTY